MNIWIVNLKSNGLSTTDEMKADYIKSNTCGMGWRLNENITSKNEYLNKAVVTWPEEEKSLTLACNNYHKMAKNDLVLTRVATHYYIGIVADDKPFYDISNNICPNNISSWMRKVTWYLIGNQDVTPAPIVAQLSSRHQKTIDIRLPWNKVLYDFCKVVCNNLSQSNYSVEKAKLTEDNFAACFDDQELEDIVGIYLQRVYKFVFYPSSCKHATKSYEYILKDIDNDKMVYVQVKHNAPIDVSKYTTDYYNNAIVYLYSNNGYVNNKNSNNIKIIDKLTLFNFVLEHINLFQKRIKYSEMLFEI